ncbi:GntR family transcriptional regulator [Dactylosporangium sp. NBC_01737]|uniref:GntR family transcriptional regulator n=1 Tax=Dactylosporangium sp. NBC_01737 TaxID=2975959 RepID=UPI002E0EE157|nr:GntR family transcriptional regulator [Dactylosporangium sp. NBC_01737]
MGIDRSDMLPVYLQLASVLRQQITAGVHRPGAALPSEDGIGRVHGVGRMSVRRALDVLRHEGLITTERGRPAVIRTHPERTFVELAGVDRLVARMPTHEQARHMRIQVGVPLLEVHRADGSLETYPADLFGACGTPRT